MTKIALTNACIIDGTGCPPIEPGRLLMTDGRVEQVGLSSAVRVPEGYRAIDLRGRTVLPALIDGHMHVTGEPGRLDHMGHVTTNLRGVGVLQRCLGWGTGTVGHAAGSAESVILRDAITSGQVRGCADLVVGAAVTATCGHVRAGNADGPWEIRKRLDGPDNRVAQQRRVHERPPHGTPSKELTPAIPTQPRPPHRGRGLALSVLTTYPTASHRSSE
jgi:imidazolonepropionase-like amidohydrolase